MKKLNLLASGVFVMAMLTSCSDDDNSSTANNSNSITEIVNTAKSGTWKITLYEDDGNDETAHFTDYDFTFENSNILTATNGTDTHTGVWSVTNSDSSDDDNDDDHSHSGDIDFNIAFTTPANFADLSDDWHILERTATKIRLVDVSGGNGGTDYLTFEKN